MAKKKYYAVQVGRIPGIYGTWDECKAQTEGVSGAKYKSFPSLEEAERYMRGANNDNLDAEGTTALSKDDLNSQVEKAVAALAENEIIAFVDGSYDVTQEKSAFGAIIFSHGGNRDILYKAFTKQLGEEFISLRNVAAELEAVKESINWAIQYDKSKISIYCPTTSRKPVKTSGRKWHLSAGRAKISLNWAELKSRSPGWRKMYLF